MWSQICQVVWRLWLEGEFFWHNEFKPFRCNNQAQLSSHLWRSCYQKIQFPIFQKMYDSIKVRSSVWCNLMYIVFALWSSENLIKSHSSIGHVVTRKVRSWELSRVPLRKVIQSLKFRKLRQEHKKMLQKPFLFYIVLLRVHVENSYSILKLVCFDSWSWQSFVTTCDVFNCLFPLDVQNEIQLLSRVFCFSWLVSLLNFWLRNALLVKVRNPISDGIVFVFDLAGCRREL